MRIALFAAILLIVVSVPAAYAATLQLVTENGNVFSIDFDEILFLWEMQNPSNQTQAIAAIQQEIADLRIQLGSITNTTDVGDLQDRIDELQAQLNSNSTSTEAAITLLESQIGMLREQLAMALTNSTATDTEIEMLQETIATLTTDLENLEQDGIGAGALGTSGRMVSAALDGYLIYGEHGKLGTISEATTYNRYTGPVDYVGIIPDKDGFTKYSLDSPNGQYTVHNSELVPVQGSPVFVRTNGDKVLEGNAPVINTHGRDVEIDVSGKVLVQLNESRLGNGAVIGVDTEGATAQVVTSPNDLINTEYRDFNGTGKFVLFEGEAQYVENALNYFRSGSSVTNWVCRDDRYGAQTPCRVTAGQYAQFLRNSGSYTKYYALLADNQTPIPHSLDVHVSDIDESFVDSNTTVPVMHGDAWFSGNLFASTTYLDGVYETNSTFVDGLSHLTGFAEGAGYSVGLVQDIGGGDRIYGSVTGFGAAHGTHRVTDETPYVIRGSVEPDNSKTIPTTTDSNVFVLLESIGNDHTYAVSNTVADAMPPAVLSIERHNPSGAITNSDTLVYKVTFSEDVIGVDADDFILTPDSTSGRNISSVTYHGPSISFSSRTNSGSVIVTENSTDMLIAIEYGFRFHGASLTLRAPDGSSQAVTGAQETLHLFDFGEGSVEGEWVLSARNSRFSGIVDSWSLSVLTGNASSPVTSVSGSGSEYYVTVPASRIGTYIIGFGLNHDIRDAVGNQLIDRTSVSDVNRVYSVPNIMDTTPPTVVSIERSNPMTQNTNSQTLTYKMTFSEDVTGVDVFDFVFSPDSVGGNNRPATSVTGSGDTYYVTVPATQDGSYNIDLASTGHGIADIASHSMVDTVSVSGVDETYVKTGSRDRENPTLSSIERYEPPNEYTDSESLTYKIMFNEDVTGVDRTDFVLSPESTGKFYAERPDKSVQTSAPALVVPYKTLGSDVMTVLDSGLAASVLLTMDATISGSTYGAITFNLTAPDGTIMESGYVSYLNGELTYSFDFENMQIAGDWTLEIDNDHSYRSITLNDWALELDYGKPRELGPVRIISGFGDTYYATVIPTQNGTFNLDLISSGHDIKDTANNRLTDTSVAVGTARIGANGIMGAGDVQINDLPSGVPWVFETVDGQQLRSGITTQSGSITMPLPDYSVEGVTGEFSLLVYEDGFGHNVQPGNLIADLLNGEFIRHDFGNPSQNIIYIPERYMLYPITVPVTIDDVRLGKLTTDCNVTDQVSLSYINGPYDAGSSMYVPFIPGMSVLKFSIDGAPVCVKFADVLPPVQIVTFSGDAATGREAPVIDLTVGATASAILATNEPTSLTVSFGASGFSEHDRYIRFLGVILRGENGEVTDCPIASNCPPEVQTLISDTRGIGSESIASLQHSYTKYEVIIDVFKNGQFYDTATMSLNSLVPVIPADLWGKYGFYNCDERDDRVDVAYSVNQTVVAGGHHYYRPGCSWGSNTDLGVFQAMTGTVFNEVVSHTFNIDDGNVGDHIEVSVSNRVIFNFAYPYGNYHPYDTEIVHYNWPSSFEDEILHDDDFLGPEYNSLEYIVQADYGSNDRGVSVAINDGTLMLVSTR